MKKYQKVLSVLFSSLLIFCAVSCANDSVEEETNNQKPNENNNYNPQIDGTYEVNLSFVTLSKSQHYSELQNDNNKEAGSMTISSNLDGLLPVSKCVIEKCAIGNGTYYYYTFDLPKQEGTNAKPNSTEKGIILSVAPIPSKKINITVTGNGKNIAFDWTVVSLYGVFVENSGNNLLVLQNQAGKNLIMVPSFDITQYVGTWQHTENPQLVYTITINADGKGKYDFGTDKKGDLSIYGKNGMALLVNSTDKTTIGSAVIVNKKLTVIPDKNSTLLKEFKEFTKVKY